MNVPFLDLAWQESLIKEEREKRFATIIENSAFVLGEAVTNFEIKFANYCNREYAIGVSAGTHALTMIFNSLGLGQDDEVITIPTTFFASATAVIHADARPVFVDIDPHTRSFNLEQLEKAITKKTKVLLVVHLYGIPVDMNPILALATKYKLTIVEDCCQAHGAKFEGKKVGTFGEASAFSFYPGKNLGAYGDGGAVVTNNKDIATKVKALRNQGCIEKYDHAFLGYNGRLDALQAAVLSSKLPHLDTWNQLRSDIAGHYLSALQGLPIVLPIYPKDSLPVWHLFVIELINKDREAFMAFLKEQGVATGIHYPIPLHTTPALSSLGYTQGDFTVSENLASSCVSLPLYPGMTTEQVAYVVQTVKKYFHA